MFWQDLFEKGKAAGWKRFGGIVLGVFVLVTTVTWWTGVQHSGKAGRHNVSSLQASKKALAFAKEQAPLHARFGEISLSIHEHENRKALEESLALEEELRNRAANEQEPLLHAFTLVRIAFLYQALGDVKNEKNAWHTVQTLAGWNTPDAVSNKAPLASSMAIVEQNFASEGSGLRDYIRHRLSVAESAKVD